MTWKKNTFWVLIKLLGSVSCVLVNSSGLMKRHVVENTKPTNNFSMETGWLKGAMWNLRPTCPKRSTHIAWGPNCSLSTCDSADQRCVGGSWAKPWIKVPGALNAFPLSHLFYSKNHFTVGIYLQWENSGNTLQWELPRDFFVVVVVVWNLISDSFRQSLWPFWSIFLLLELYQEDSSHWLGIHGLSGGLIIL